MTGPSRKIYLYLFLVLLFALALQHYLIKRGDVTVPVRAGDAPEDVGFDLLDGRRVELGELEGQIVVLDFWASWCVPCRRQMPILEEFHDSLKTPDCLRMIAVNVRESRETAEKFLREFPVGYDVALDPDGIIAENFRVRSLPTLVVLDKKGEVLWVKEGFEPSIGMALQRRLSKKIPDCVAPPTDQMAEALKAMGVDVPDTEADENEDERDSIK
jgi:thiol-disulfide isomerase/thioredoxin